MVRIAPTRYNGPTHARTRQAGTLYRVVVGKSEAKEAKIELAEGTAYRIDRMSDEGKVDDSLNVAAYGGMNLLEPERREHNGLLFRGSGVGAPNNPAIRNDKKAGGEGNEKTME